MFQRAAARFKAEHGRPAVLVLDDINIIAQANPDLLRILQHHAKKAADNELFKFVFVCSDGVAPLQLSGKLGPVHFRNAGANTAQKTRRNPECLA